MKRQKDTKTRVLAQKLMDDYLKRGRDSQEDWLIEHDEFLKYPNKELFEYLETDYTELIKILDDLKNRGVIFQYECLDTEEAVNQNKKVGLEGYRTTGFSINRMPKYEECVIKTPDDFFEKTETFLARPTSNADTDPIGVFALYLDKHGNLWHGNKEDNYYPMGQNSTPFFIFKYLVDNNSNFAATSDIASALNAKFSKQKKPHDVSVIISKMRRLIYSKLGIDGHDLIESKKDSGYRISRKYQIHSAKT